MAKKKEREFGTGVTLFVVGLISLYQGHLDGCLLFCGIGVGVMADGDPERMSQVWQLLFGGFTKLLQTVFSFFR